MHESETQIADRQSELRVANSLTERAIELEKSDPERAAVYRRDAARLREANERLLLITAPPVAR